MPVSSLEDVQSRIAVIEQRLGIKTDDASSSASSFSNVLESVLGKTGSSGTGSGLMSILAGGDSDGSTVTGGDIVADASKYLGIPYVWGGTDPAKGLDCSGLVQLVYKDMGISLPRTAAQQATQGTKVDSLAQAKPGDLVAFGSPVDHIGIYAGDNKMIVAPKKGDVVKVQDVYKTPVAIRRILPDDAPVSANNSLSLDKLASLASTLSTGASSSFGNLSSQYNGLFTAAGAKYNISPNLLAAVAKAESGFNASAKSGAGALGLMQIMPGTAKGLGVDPMNPTQAVDGAAKMLSGLVSKFGSTSLALAAYNAGPGAVQKYDGIPPYTETQNYVKKVLALATGAK